MMFRIIFSGMTVLAVLAFQGCSSTKPYSADPNLEKAGNITPKMANRARIFRKSISGKTECDFIVSAPSYRGHANNYDQLAARLAALGVKTVYLDSTQEVGMKTDESIRELRNILKVMRYRKLKCYLIVYDYQLINTPEQSGKTLAAKLLDFNSNAENNLEKLDGMVNGIVPDQIDYNNYKVPNGIWYRWNSQSWGKGRDNDILMQNCLKSLETIKSAAPGFPILQIVNHTYQKLYEEGKLNCGSSAAFLKNTQYLLVECYSNYQRDVFEYALPYLKTAKRQKSITIMLKSDPKTFLGGAIEKSISSKEWFRVLGDLRFIIRATKRYPAFRGFAFNNYAGFEDVWESIE